MDIKTVDDWWKQVDAEWTHLMEIVSHHIDMQHIAYEVPGDLDSPMTMRPVYLEMVKLKEERDQRLARYFFAAWSLAPETYAWSVPGWGALCDLLSEEWVFCVMSAA